MVKNSARVNEETDPALLLQRQQQENAALREELALLKEGADVRLIVCFVSLCAALQLASSQGTSSHQQAIVASF